MRATSPASVDLATRCWHDLRDFVADERRRGEIADSFGLGRGRGRLKVLRAIVDGPLMLREVAERIQVDAPYATVIVDNLETAGLVRRTIHPDDRRRRLVTITDRGLEAVTHAERVLSQPPPELRALDDDDLLQLTSLLDRVLGHRRGLDPA